MINGRQGTGESKKAIKREGRKGQREEIKIGKMDVPVNAGKTKYGQQ